MRRQHFTGMEVAAVLALAATLGAAACRSASSGAVSGSAARSTSPATSPSTAVTTTALVGDTTTRPSPRATTTTTAAARAATTTIAAAVTVCLTGTFTTIFGGPAPVYFLTEGALRTEIVLGPGAADGAGGPLAVDRHRVTVRGRPLEPTASGTPRLQATVLELGDGGCR